uniref:Mind bomb SH3 repeat domain-containing protein n=1 Tax=Octopus bimaculoides TaxID=37653 RepID=A0A0L8FXJ4_OCTBM
MSGCSDSCVQINVGDKVCTHVDEQTLKNNQYGHGGWDRRMPGLIKKIGTVVGISDNGDVEVKFEKYDEIFTFNKASLVVVHIDD